MSLLKRLSATFIGRIDQVVGEIENHDAVIQAALRDMRRTIAEARVRLARVQRQAEKLRRETEEQREAAQRWRQRAVEAASGDEATGLECLRRAKQCDRQADRLCASQTQYEQAVAQLVTDIDTSEQRQHALEQKHALLRARHSVGTALNATSEWESTVFRQLDDSFERWEIRIGQIETAVEHPAPVDPLERDFLSREQELELRTELALLKGKESGQ